MPEARRGLCGSEAPGGVCREGPPHSWGQADHPGFSSLCLAGRRGFLRGGPLAGLAGSAILHRPLQSLWPGKGDQSDLEAETRALRPARPKSFGGGLNLGRLLCRNKWAAWGEGGYLAAFRVRSAASVSPVGAGSLGPNSGREQPRGRLPPTAVKVFLTRPTTKAGPPFLKSLPAPFAHWGLWRRTEPGGVQMTTPKTGEALEERAEKKLAWFSHSPVEALLRVADFAGLKLERSGRLDE